MTEEGGKGFALGLFLFGLGWWLFIHGFRLYKRKRKIEDTPRSKISSMAIGPVEVSGRVKTQFDLKSPISGLNVVYYYYLIEERRGTGKRKSWVKLCEGDSREYEFWIRDESGTAMVLPKGASLELRGKFVYGPAELPPGVFDVLESENIAPRGLLGFERHLRCTEQYVLPNEEVYILGTALSVSQTMKGEQRDMLIEKIKDAKANPEIMRAIDSNQDGKVDDREWDHARRFIENKVSEKFKSEFGDLSIAAHGDNEFIISGFSQSELLGRYRWQTVAMILGGPLMSFIGFLIICSVLKLGDGW